VFVPCVSSLLRTCPEIASRLPRDSLLSSRFSEKDLREDPPKTAVFRVSRVCTESAPNLPRVCPDIYLREAKIRRIFCFRVLLVIEAPCLAIVSKLSTCVTSIFVGTFCPETTTVLHVLLCRVRWNFCMKDEMREATGLPDIGWFKDDQGLEGERGKEMTEMVVRASEWSVPLPTCPRLAFHLSILPRNKGKSVCTPRSIPTGVSLERCAIC